MEVASGAVAASMADVAAVELFSGVVSGTGVISGESDAGLTVPLDSGIRMKSSICSAPLELNRGLDRERGEGWLWYALRGEELRPGCPRRRCISSIKRSTVLFLSRSASSSSLHLSSKASTS